MNDPSNLPIDIDEQRKWIKDHKATTGLSWADLAKQSDVPVGTLSNFAGGTYPGRNDNIARSIFRFRQMLSTQAELAGDLPDVPGYFETVTSRRITSLLTYSHRGRMTAAAMGPGTGKTMTAGHYRDSVSGVFLVTLAPSSSKVTNMQVKVLDAMGERNAWGRPAHLSNRICERVRGRRSLIIIDEAQHATEGAIEEIRSWYDQTGVGIALLGNHDVIGRLEGGTRKAAYAQLYSRIGMRHVQNLPHHDDARALACAWGVDDDRMTAFIVRQSQMPGGLRGVTHMLELATMIASADERGLEIKDLQEAWSQLVSRPLAA